MWGKLGYFLSEMKLGRERLDLLQQPINKFLRAAYRQRRDIVDRFIRIQLRALSARVRERVDDVRLYAQQPELENLKQTTGTCADDEGVSPDRSLRSGE